ncbi:MAG TPA: radical SAM protein [Candidatus Sumerlaeota bacterium]|nr:radical SAM protein [Candidatus Sumerlaeota bacterium]
MPSLPDLPEPSRWLRRALLVNPPSGLYRRDGRCQSRVEDQAVRVILPPHDLALVAAIVREAGAEARVGDYPAMGASWDRLRADLEAFKPDLILFNVTAATADADLGAARLARELFPTLLTIGCGEVFDRAGEHLLETCPELDLALFGEPEATFQVLTESARGRGVRYPLDIEIRSRLGALLWRDPDGEESVTRQAGPALVADLDSLPLPARDLLDNSLYRSPETGRPLTTIKANRGCPSKCIFCPAGRMSGYRLRLRSPRQVVQELLECRTKFGIRDFLFDGDTFTLNKRWLLELCDRIAHKSPLRDIRWGCNSRVDTMDAERAKAMRRAGCILVAFGVESGDQELLNAMKKGTRVEQAEQAVAVCKAAGLATHAFFVIGLPWETRESLDRTYRFIQKLNTDLFDINIATPLPGTDLYDLVRKEGLLRENLPPGNYAQAMADTRTLPAEFLTRWRRNALLKLYARPRYVAHMLLRAWRTGCLPFYLRAAWGRLKGLVRNG